MRLRQNFFFFFSREGVRPPLDFDKPTRLRRSGTGTVLARARRLRRVPPCGAICTAVPSSRKRSSPGSLARFVHTALHGPDDGGSYSCPNSFRNHFFKDHFESLWKRFTLSRSHVACVRSIHVLRVHSTSTQRNLSYSFISHGYRARTVVAPLAEPLLCPILQCFQTRAKSNLGNCALFVRHCNVFSALFRQGIFFQISLFTR